MEQVSTILLFRIKSAADMANESFGQPGVESILPDDVNLSDNLPVPSAPPPLVQKPPTSQSNKPVILNHVLFKPKKHQVVVHPVRVTVGNSCAATISRPESPKVIIQAYKARKVQPTSTTAVVPAVGSPSNAQVPPTIVPIAAERGLPSSDTICLDSDEEDSAAPPAQPSPPVPVSLSMAAAPGVTLQLPALTPVSSLVSCHQLQTSQKHTLVLRQVVTKDGVQPKYVLIPSNQLPLPKISTTEQPQLPSAQPEVTSTFQAMPGESVLSTKKLEISQTNSKTLCKTNDIIQITNTGQIELIEKVAPPAPPPQVATIPQLRQIAPKPSQTMSVDLTNIPIHVAKPTPATAKHSIFPPIDLTDQHIEVATTRPVVGNHSRSASVDLTNVPTSKSRLGPKPSTSAPVDLATKQKPAASPKPTATKSENKVAARKARRISSSSSSSSCTSIPENPLSILRDVVHIRAADYPVTSTASKPSNSKSIVLRTEKCANSNISIQHIVSADSKNTAPNAKKTFTPETLKLTQVPKNKVPKYVDTAVEKHLKKDALLKKITPFLTKNQPKHKEEPKPRGKNTINIDTFSSTANTLLKSNAVAGKPANRKSESSRLSKPSGSKASVTVDLT